MLLYLTINFDQYTTLDGVEFSMAYCLSMVLLRAILGLAQFSSHSSQDRGLDGFDASHKTGFVVLAAVRRGIVQKQTAAPHAMQ